MAGVPTGALLGTATGWRTTFWAISLLCVPAAIGILRGVTDSRNRADVSTGSPRLRAELGQLRSHRLLLAIGGPLLLTGWIALVLLAPVWVAAGASPP